MGLLLAVLVKILIGVTVIIYVGMTVTMAVFFVKRYRSYTKFNQKVSQKKQKAGRR